MDDRERELLSAWESGNETAGLVLADWLEGQGDERADGVRWLAENGKRPEWESDSNHYGAGYHWWEWAAFKGDEDTVPSSAQLPLDSDAAGGAWYRAHPDFPSAIYAAASAWTAAQREGATT